MLDGELSHARRTPVLFMLRRLPTGLPSGPRVLAGCSRALHPPSNQAKTIQKSANLKNTHLGRARHVLPQPCYSNAPLSLLVGCAGGPAFMLGSPACDQAETRVFQHHSPRWPLSCVWPGGQVWSRCRDLDQEIRTTRFRPENV